MKKSGTSRVQRRLEAKNAVLQRWVEDTVPPTYKETLRPSLRWYAQWSDPSLGVAAVTSPNAVSKTGPYGNLICEAERLLRLLQKTERTRSTKSQENDRLRAANLELRRLLEQMTSQWHAERARLGELADRLAFVQAARDRAEQRIGELTQKLAAVVPLRVLSRPDDPMTRN